MGRPAMIPDESVDVTLPVDIVSQTPPRTLSAQLADLVAWIKFTAFSGHSSSHQIGNDNGRDCQ
jgi:hypothetical protein